MSHNDDGLPPHRLNIVSQLPDSREEALSVLKYARDLIEFLYGRPRQPAPVVSIASIRESEPPELN
jgi:hypothetical protein